MRGNIYPCRNIITFANYVLFFPKVLQGPIVSYKNLSEDLSSPKKFNAERLEKIEEELEGAKEYFHYHDRCLFCDIVRQESKDKSRLVYEDDNFIIFCPFASRFPFEMEIAPKSHQPFFEMIENDMVIAFAKALQIALKKQETLLPGQPYNFILHTSPCSDAYKDFYHWHLEIIPKLTKTAGFEWGSGFYINPTPPEDAAEALRNVEIK